MLKYELRYLSGRRPDNTPMPQYGWHVLTWQSALWGWFLVDMTPSDERGEPRK